MAVDFIIVRPKHVAAVGFAIINGVCQPTASLLSVCDTGRLRKNVKKISGGRGQLKCDGTRAETRFRLSAKRTSPF